MESCLTERDATREIFGFALSVICLRKRCHTVNILVMTALSLVLNDSLITIDVFVVVLQQIPCSVCCLLCSGQQ